MVVNGNEHEVKTKIYNTKCSMDIGAKGTNPENKYEHLGDITVAKHFAKKVIPLCVENISAKLNMYQINEECRKLALMGMQTKHQTFVYFVLKKTKTNVIGVF